MPVSKHSTFTSHTRRKPVDGYYTLKINQIRTGLLDSMFCGGRCNEATTFEHLCAACLDEYFTYKGERNEE